MIVAKAFNAKSENVRKIARDIVRKRALVNQCLKKGTIEKDNWQNEGQKTYLQNMHSVSGSDIFRVGNFFIGFSLRDFQEPFYRQIQQFPRLEFRLRRDDLLYQHRQTGRPPCNGRLKALDLTQSLYQRLFDNNFVILGAVLEDRRAQILNGQMGRLDGALMPASGEHANHDTETILDLVGRQATRTRRRIDAQSFGQLCRNQGAFFEI